MSELIKITARIYYFPFDDDKDRPVLGYIRGDRFSVAVDAGHSAEHVADFYRAIKMKGLPEPALTVITHWHWDHTFGMHAVKGKTMASRRTNAHLRQIIATHDVSMTDLPAAGAPAGSSNTFTDSDGSSDIQRATEVAFDGDDIYVKGIPFYFEDSWMKGTIDQQTGIATFPSGQFVGEDEYGIEFMLGYGEDGVCDIEFAYDADAQTLTQITPSIVENGSSATELEPWGWWTDMVIFGGVIETVEVPEDLVTDAYLFKANEYVEEDVKDEEGNVIDTNVSWEEYTYQMQVGFDGKDVYFNGFSDNTAEFWAKGTLSDDGTTVTIPASQFLGELNILWYSFKYYLTAVDGDGNLTDIVLNYDAETNAFSTD